MSQVFSRDLEKDVAGDTSGYFKKFLTSLLQVKFIVIVICSGGSRRGARGGGGGPPLFLKQTKARRAQKMFLETAPPFSKGLDARAPSPLISGSESGTDLGLEQAHKNSQARRWAFLFMKDFLFFLFLYFFLNKIIDKIGVKVRPI